MLIKTTATIPQRQSPVVKAVSNPTCLPKIIARRKRTRPINRYTKTIWSKYPQVDLRLCIIRGGPQNMILIDEYSRNPRRIVQPIFIDLGSGNN